MAQDKDNSKPTWAQAFLIIVLRLIDSGLAPWVAVAGFLLGGLWICMRNMDSKDTLNLLSSMISLRGLVWLGWVIAFVEIPICKWALNREKRMRRNKTNKLEEDLEKAMKLVKQYKLTELNLEG